MSEMLDMLLLGAQGLEGVEGAFGQPNNQGFAQRMMQSQNFVESLNSSHDWVMSSWNNPLAAPNLNFTNCPVYSLG